MSGERAITAETAFDLSRYFGTSPDFWLRLQTFYDRWRDTPTNGV